MFFIPASNRKYDVFMPIHVAILWREYIDLILAGTKTIESRLTMRPLEPFDAIKPGELIFFKQSSGPYRARATVKKIRFYKDLSPEKIRQLKEKFNAGVCGPEDYWRQKETSKCATFITLENVQPIAIGPIMPQSRGLAWFVLPKRTPLGPVQRKATTSRDRKGAVELPYPEKNRSLTVAARQKKKSQTKTKHVFEVPLLDGAIRNRYVRIPLAIHAFPSQCYGGSRSTQKGETLTLELPDNQIVLTDLTPTGMIRWRGWGRLFDIYPSVRRLLFEQITPLRYRVRILHDKV